MYFIRLTCIFVGCLLAVNTAFAEDFSDVPKGHYAYEAIGYLRERKILLGYADGTFRPDQRVNRAEALKIIVSPLVTDEALAKLTSSQYTDVPSGTWFSPYVEWARLQTGIIDGPPKSSVFNPTKAVTKAEFLKMLFASRKADLRFLGDVTLPLASDVSNSKDWYYQYMRYALGNGVTFPTSDGLLRPNYSITRGDVALLLHRYLLYRAGEQVQPMLSQTKKELEGVLAALEKQKIKEAEYASARAIVLARGARESKPNEPVVKVTVKITEGYRALVRSYQAALNKDLQGVIKHAQDAWYLGEQAKGITPESAELARQLQELAKKFAAQARSHQ